MSGRVLPVMTSISVVLPAPLGPMTQRSSPRSSSRVMSLSALNPSKLTVTFSTQSARSGEPMAATPASCPAWEATPFAPVVRGADIAVMIHAWGTLGAPPSREEALPGRPGSETAPPAVVTAAAPAGMPSAVILPADSVAGEGERPRRPRARRASSHNPTRPLGKNSVTTTNKRAEHVEPGRREGRREPALGAVDEPGPEHRTDQGAAPTDRDPDRHFDRVRRAASRWG